MYFFMVTSVLLYYLFISGRFDLCRGCQVLTAAGGFRLSTNAVCVELLRFPALPLLPLFLCLVFVLLPRSCCFSSLVVFSSIPWLFFSAPLVPSPCPPDTTVLLSSLSVLSVWGVLTQGSIQALIKKTCSYLLSALVRTTCCVFKAVCFHLVSFRGYISTI